MPLRNFVTFNSVERGKEISYPLSAVPVFNPIQIGEIGAAKRRNLGVDELIHFSLNGRGWVCHKEFL